MSNKFFRQNMQKYLKQKSEHRHRILHIQNGLDTKFQLKLTILNFWTKSTRKG